MNYTYTVTGQRTTDGWMYSVVHNGVKHLWIWVYVLNNDSPCYLYAYMDDKHNTTYNVKKFNKSDILYEVWKEALCVANERSYISFEAYRRMHDDCVIYHDTLCSM